MKKPNNTVMNYIYISTYTIILLFALINIKHIFGALGTGIDIIKPFIMGICIAFILNILVKVFEEKVFGFIECKTKKTMKAKRPLSIVASIILVITIFTLLITFILPQLFDSVKTLLDTIPGHVKNLEEFITPFFSSTEFTTTLWENFMKVWKDVVQVLGQVLTVSFNSIISTTVTATSTVINFFIGFVFAIYMLLSKETFIIQIKKIIYAFMKKEHADSLVSVGKIINVTFSKFLAGQCVEALIVGGLTFIGMIIFGMPYPLLIGTIIGVTNMLPIVGPIIGCIPSAFIILMVDPTQALWFVVFVIVLQQIESNLIYPKVVGTSIGLTALWVLLAITIGGSLGGALGMLLAVPSMAVIYKLGSGMINQRLRKKELFITSDSVIKNEVSIPSADAVIKKENLKTDK